MMKNFMGGCLFVFGGALAVVFGMLSLYTLFGPEKLLDVPTVVIFFFCLIVGYIGFQITRLERTKRKKEEVQRN